MQSEIVWVWYKAAAFSCLLYAQKQCYITAILLHAKAFNNINVRLKDPLQRTVFKYLFSKLIIFVLNMKYNLYHDLILTIFGALQYFLTHALFFMFI
jgi:hypothetical protein